ncbi:sugar ABC transporter ATP-binding protein [Ruminococcus sp. OA3]|uniref:sugar ABC transporter ATP-binding protein n=1 Tax=Ruminococcus sp. OA3 TaxID=2914164 RepID=UPI001F065BBA|nr:sugar ABC transporter ATP-binding protein [Ruminococcus sp. OA3]MCH1981062.1 sugar ABC transporter ATP-binding protein [Ruminococcus sp. OA3]
MSDTPLLQMEHIRKVFPGVVALDDVSLTIKEGTVHALMGENGAGKSTLMKILTGVYTRTEGSIRWQGQDLDTSSITNVLHSGITMIFQELNPIKTMKVCENIFVGREPYRIKGLMVDHRKIAEDTRALFEELEMTDIDPNAMVGTLSTAKMQMIEIAKAISYHSKLIIMDEPTSSITEKECQHLFRLVNNLKKKGIAFIFITHKMDEVFQISDEITVMRDGTYVGTYDVKDISQEELVKLMVGREITNMFPKEEAEIGEVKLEVTGMNVKDLLHDINFRVHKGEILGFAGLMGAGRTEVMETLFGIRKMDTGTVKIDGQKVHIDNPKQALKHKIAFLTEDRRGTGCFLPLSVGDNIMVCNYDRAISGFGKISISKEKKLCREQIEKYAVKTPGASQIIGNLSGGNQQKVLIARWLMMEPDIIILDEPTRGIDVGSKSEIHRMISSLAKQGVAVILISSELPEVIGMSDRIMVMYEGRITGEVARSEATQENIMRYASGITE